MEDYMVVMLRFLRSVSTTAFGLMAIGFLLTGCGRSFFGSSLYLGQTPPGTTPEVFGYGIISTGHHEFSLSVAPSGNEVLFTRRPVGTNANRILVSRLENGQWSVPVLAPFAVDTRESEPNYSPNGKRVYFNSRRPLPPEVRSDDPFNVWIVTRSDDGWDEPQFIGRPVSAIRPMFVTESNSGTIYMTGTRQRGIYKASSSYGAFDVPTRLPDTINSRDWPGHPYIAPDERFLIFDSNVDDRGTKNLFVSFKDRNGEWSVSVNLTEHLGFPSGSMPHVTFDGRYLFFSSNGDIYWVDASVIDELR